jgi:hypothetical protein
VNEGFSTPDLKSILINSDLQPNRNDFSCFKIVIEGKENCNRNETDIHALLDSLDVYKINVKEFLQDQARVDSPEIKKAFAEQRSR